MKTMTFLSTAVLALAIMQGATTFASERVAITCNSDSPSMSGLTAEIRAELSRSYIRMGAYDFSGSINMQLFDQGEQIFATTLNNISGRMQDEYSIFLNEQQSQTGQTITLNLDLYEGTGTLQLKSGADLNFSARCSVQFQTENLGAGAAACIAPERLFCRAGCGCYCATTPWCTR